MTLSTVGYGDILPADDGVRLLAAVQAVMGQLLLLFGFYEIMRGSQAGTPMAEPPEEQTEPPESAEDQGVAPTDKVAFRPPTRLY